jgi:hypothetical protein
MVDVKLEGWNLKVEQVMLDGGSEWSDVKAELARQLQNIERVVADEPLGKLRKVTIWIYRNDEATPCMAYHPGPAWLVERKLPAEMAKCVEIANTGNFLSWTYEQPWMVLHELAHSYHDQFLDKGFENPEVKDAYEEAKKSGLYEKVVHWDGKEVKHYAMNNQMEYFAEASEAYFGTNDFYPFVRGELMRYDPKTYELMRYVWGDRTKRTPKGSG